MFGEYTHNIDKKGRMFIPSKFREKLGEKFMICKGLDKRSCLVIYSLEEWELFDAKIQSLPMSQSIQLQRFIYPGAAEVEYDSQGRILIPAKLREYAGLDASAVIVGLSNRAEVWSPDNWNDVSSDCTSENAFDLMEKLNF